VSVYDKRPDAALEKIHDGADGQIHCAGFEADQWRVGPFVNQLIDWLPDYALLEAELEEFDHANAYAKLQQAAVRVYTSDKYAKRGEVGEIALHAICRTELNTIPISPRVFYKSASNDVVKSFDLVHARIPDSGQIDLILGESKLYEDNASAIREAISSVRDHVENGFLTNQKILLGPQIPKATPRYQEVRDLFNSRKSNDFFVKAAVFVIGIFSNSEAFSGSNNRDAAYMKVVRHELALLDNAMRKSHELAKLRLLLFYVPLGSKRDVVDRFDAKLKGLQ
jgi:hypothetical protein